MKEASEHMGFGSYTLEIRKKKIKNIYFRIYPSTEKIVVSAPVHIHPEILNQAILSKKEWIHKQVNKPCPVLPIPAKTYTTGEEILFLGEIHTLCVRFDTVRPQAFVSGPNRIDLIVKPGCDVHGREKVILNWLRNELKKTIGQYVSLWEPRMGVTVKDFNVRRMKTRWGSCNIHAGRIWLNLALVHLPDRFLEYVVVHEMVHLLERRHNARFKGFMDRFIPDWRGLKKELN